MPWTRESPPHTSSPAISVSPGMTAPSLTDVTTSIMMILTVISGAPHIITNITSLLQTIRTEENTEMTSVITKLVSLLNSTESTSQASDFPTSLTVVNGTDVYLYDAMENSSSFVTGISVLPKEPALSLESTGDIDNEFTNLTTEDSSVDELASSSSLVNFSELERNLFNSTVGSSNVPISDTADYFDMTSSVTNSTIMIIASEINELDLDPDSRNLSSEQYLDNTEDKYLDTESISPSNFDGNDKSRNSKLVTDDEQLTSYLLTTVENVISQWRDSSSSNEYTEQTLQMLQKSITDYPVKNIDPTKCLASQCNIMPSDATATSELSLTTSTITEKQDSTTVTMESTLALGKIYGRYKINTNKFYLALP